MRILKPIVGMVGPWYRHVLTWPARIGSHAEDLRPRSFGLPGSGGSIGFGYVTNLWNFRPDDPRASNLANAVRSCLG
ncbi:hypothetical protein [Nonomuraea jabiensis]|uniref:hypothetical protein n=1 Tax=Nonomuraea jabiensis TaxID=882448 RepID=UPI003D71BD5F